MGRKGTPSLPKRAFLCFLLFLGRGNPLCWRERVFPLPLEHFQFESIFSLKCFAFQTIRPVVSRKKRGFSAHFGPGGAVPPPRVSPFSKLKRSSPLPFPQRALFWRISRYGNAGAFLPASVPVEDRLIPCPLSLLLTRLPADTPPGTATHANFPTATDPLRRVFPFYRLLPQPRPSSLATDALRRGHTLRPCR